MQSATSAVSAKLARFRKGRHLRVLDLFAGCGGLSLGFQAAGFEIAASVEMDPDAAQTHAVNFHGGSAAHARPRDITLTPPEALSADLGLDDVGYAVDVLVGGPPCQAFARVGRSKLREVADHPYAFRHDPRARLYIDYLSYVRAFAPLAVVMENVPDMLNHGGHNIASEVCEVLGSLGFVCRYTLLNAAFYGVPQMRERMFLIGIRQELADSIRFPEPTHWLELPAGYEGSRSVALKLVAGLPMLDAGRYEPPPTASPDLHPAVTASEAIGDLPEIDARAEIRAGRLKRGARRFTDPLAYQPARPPSPYALLMREWPGFGASPTLTDHVIRFLPRDGDIFARMRAGDQYPEACAHAEALFAEAVRRHQAAGRAIKEGASDWLQLRKAIVPPYAADKFPNKWRKMEHDWPARTLLAHLGKDSYSHIHYDSRQARTISVREAARLQSFPDGFRFCGTMNPAFRQIGNAVPPLLAKAVAACLMSQLSAAAGARPARARVGTEG